MKVIIGVLVGLAVFTVAIIILANSIGDLEQEAVNPEARGPQAIEKRIAPVGEVRVAGQDTEAQAEAEKAAAAPRSGEEIYTAACAACHGTGAAGAPKLDDEAAWQPRLDKGFDTLLSHAINGFKGMPARGGNPNLTDAEMHRSVAYMVEAVGGSAPPAPEADTGDGDGAPAAADSGEGAQPEGEGQDEGQGEGEGEGQSTAPAGAEASAAQASAGQASAGQAEGQESASGSGIDAWLAETDLGKGEQVYQGACSVCHKNGVAGAPKLGDSAAWDPRIAKGRETLVSHAINGFRGMPPKGGRMDLANEAVAAATAYMVQESR